MVKKEQEVPKMRLPLEIQREEMEGEREFSFSDEATFQCIKMLTWAQRTLEKCTAGDFSLNNDSLANSSMIELKKFWLS